MTTDSAIGGHRARHQGPRKTTARSLENTALHYLARFAASAANLRRVLLRRVERSARVHGTDRSEGEKLIAELIARFERSGLIDDRGFAASRALALHRRGASARAIRGRLLADGVAPDLVAAALAALADDVAEPEFAAAVAYARRRRLGPYRKESARPDFRPKDLAAFARAGFSFEVARRVIDAPSAASLEQDLGGEAAGR